MDTTKPKNSVFFIRKWHLGRKQYAQADCYSNKVSLTCFIDSNNVGSVTNSNVLLRYSYGSQIFIPKFFWNAPFLSIGNEIALLWWVARFCWALILRFRHRTHPREPRGKILSLVPHWADKPAMHTCERHSFYVNESLVIFGKSFISKCVEYLYVVECIVSLNAWMMCKFQKYLRVFNAIRAS